MKLKEGDKAPGFNLKDQNGNDVKLSNFKGKNIVLYFYPKDLTPGCTKEACGFRDNFEKFRENDIVVLGVSLDNESLHKRFIQKYKLPFALLCDTDKKVSKLYGVYGKKKFMGREYFGVKRKTFVIGKKGNISKIFDDVDVETHSKEVLDFILEKKK